MAKKIVWKKADGNLRISHPDVSKKSEGETDEEFYNRMIERWKELDPSLSGLDVSLVDERDIPNNRSRRSAWRLNPAGKVIPDPSVETPSESKARRINAVKNKLKANAGLTDEELEALIK